MKKVVLPRLLLAATRSGVGKTTMTCALLAAFQARGLTLSAFKCGPDYIDPMFHRAVFGANGCNLDLFFNQEAQVCSLLAQYGQGSQLAVLEGVMGYYDGLGGFTDRASAHHLACATNTPALLVVDAEGASRSLLALVQGFCQFQKPSGICGILLNRCSPMLYPKLAAEMEKNCGLPVLGYLPRMPKAALSSRHLGLVTAAEVPQLSQKLKALGEQAQKSVDLDRILALAATAPVLDEPRAWFKEDKKEPVKIALAQDEAFCFYYRENLDLLRQAGAELVPFSPLRDKALPKGVAALYLGGGYPELYTAKLAQNEPMRRAILQAGREGMPIFAECGGFLYLQQALCPPESDQEPQPMCQLLPGVGKNTGHLTRFGYVTLTAKQDNLLLKKGEQIPAHEFHYYDCTDPGQDLLAQKADGRSWDCAVAKHNLFAGFGHLYFPAKPQLAQRLVEAARYWQKQNL